MMLPEHVSLIRELKEELNHKTKIELDEQKLIEMNEVIAEGMAFNESFAFTYYENHDYHCQIGRISRYDQVAEKLYIVDHFGDKQTLRIEDIIDVRIYK